MHSLLFAADFSSEPQHWANMAKITDGGLCRAEASFEKGWESSHKLHPSKVEMENVLYNLFIPWQSSRMTGKLNCHQIPGFESVIARPFPPLRLSTRQVVSNDSQIIIPKVPMDENEEYRPWCIPRMRQGPIVESCALWFRPGDTCSALC